MFLLSASSCALSTGCDVSSSSKAHSYSSSLLFTLPSSYPYCLVLWLFQQPLSFFSPLITFSFRLSEPLLSAFIMLFFSLFLTAQWYFIPRHKKKQLKAEWRPGRAEARSGLMGCHFHDLLWHSEEWRKRLKLKPKLFFLTSCLPNRQPSQQLPHYDFQVQAQSPPSPASQNQITPHSALYYVAFWPALSVALSGGVE